MVLRRPICFKRGDKGPFIADAQEMLAKLGFDPGQPEGAFVSKTEDAVRAFQRECGLEVTGLLDCKTLKALYEEADPGGYPAVLMEGGEASENPDESASGKGESDDGDVGDAGSEGGEEGEEEQGGGQAGALNVDEAGSEGGGLPNAGQRGEEHDAPVDWRAGLSLWFRRLLKGGVRYSGDARGGARRDVRGESSVRQGKQVAGTGSAGGAASAAGTPSGSTPELVRATGGAATSSPAKVTGTASAVATGPQRTIVISVGERALGLYEGNRLVRRYPVAIGKPSTPTPVGTHRVLEKVMHPGGGLGSRWMAFTYEMHGIHGTNRPELIGQMVSNGCVRMHNANVEELYAMVEVGTPVVVITGAVESWPGLGKPAGAGAAHPAAQGPGLGGSAAGPGGSGQIGSAAQPGSGTGQGAGAEPPPAGGTGMPGGGLGLGTPGSPQQPKDALTGRAYTVQPGDSLWAIAQRFGTTVAAIVAANNIRNPDLIYPGEVLRIP